MAYLKFALLLVFNIMACIRAGIPAAVPFSAAELVLIFLTSAAIARRSHIAGYLANVFLTFLFGAQTFVLLFSGEFISTLMLENINMTGNLGNDLILYIAMTIPALGVVFLPCGSRTSLSDPAIAISAASFIIITASITCIADSGKALTPLFSTADTTGTLLRTSVRRLFRTHTDPESIIAEFTRDSIPGNGSKGLIPYKGTAPNIIIIFTEGLSAEVIDSYNKSGIGLTPNIDSLKARSLVFENYYNHTVATFRGLRGQLYSSHQELAGYYPDGSGFGQLDKDQMSRKTSTKMISLIDIVRKYGYSTYFVNPEPGSMQTTAYMESFGPDKVTSGKFAGKETLSDKELFSVLEETVLKCREDGSPFLVCSYNLGTHHGFDSPDVKYGNGKNPILNKFHNYDAQLGHFLKRMNDNDVFDNTILFFTADHASYPAPEFLQALGSNQKYFIAPIPLFVHTAGIKPGSIDVHGRNSLGLAPTIIDIIGNPEMRHEKNLFLGNSLFHNAGRFDNIALTGDDFFITSDRGIEKIHKHPVISDIKKYYIISINK